MRVLAFLLLLTVLPTVELAEQAAHVVEHLFEVDVPDHDAHHDEAAGDEHGCTGLVHLCGGHQAQVTTSVALVQTRRVDIHEAVASTAPLLLFDLTSQEPAQRPPIV